MSKLNPKKFGVRVVCAVCGISKAPIGRSVPMELRMCDSECAGYHQPPLVGSLWPAESETEFGYNVGDVGVDYL